MVDMTKNIEAKVYQEAYEAAMAACNACKPVPMIVGQARGLFGNDIIPGTEEFVADGVCGFAYVHLMKATGPFVSWLKKQKGTGWNANPGWDIPMRMGEQSMQRKEAAGKAFCEVLKKYGVDCYMWSRMD